KLFSRSAHTTEKSELKNLFKKRRSKNLNFENNVAEVLKKARLQKNLSQRALAKIINVPYQAIQRWEYGTLQPSLKHFLNLCKALDLEAKDFFF
ncbi:MAG TPA: helix-turn-helix transcriptional regulator, partial [Candidatus Pacearchaeota archaeon]|nr:helix-turn-helix transcriptional regulator [Candidatus Pacearchaeota archaeon]